MVGFTLFIQHIRNRRSCWAYCIVGYNAVHSKLWYTHIGRCRPAGYSMHEDSSHTMQSAEIVRVVLQTNAFLNIARGVVLLTRYKATGPLWLAPVTVSHRFAISKHLILWQRSQTHRISALFSFSSQHDKEKCTHYRASECTTPISTLFSTHRAVRIKHTWSQRNVFPLT